MYDTIKASPMESLNIDNKKDIEEEIPEKELKEDLKEQTPKKVIQTEGANKNKQLTRKVKKTKNERDFTFIPLANIKFISNEIRTLADSIDELVDSLDTLVPVITNAHRSMKNINVVKNKSSQRYNSDLKRTNDPKEDNNINETKTKSLDKEDLQKLLQNPLVQNILSSLGNKAK